MKIAKQANGDTLYCLAMQKYMNKSIKDGNSGNHSKLPGLPVDEMGGINAHDVELWEHITKAGGRDTLRMTGDDFLIVGSTRVDAISRNERSIMVPLNINAIERAIYLNRYSGLYLSNIV